MQITFDSNKDDLTEVIKTVKFLQNYKLENKSKPVNEAETSDEPSAPSPLSVTAAGSSEAPKKRGRKPKTDTVQVTVENQTAAPVQVDVAPTQSPPVAQPSAFAATQPAPAPTVEAYTAQQFYQVIVDLNKAGTFNPNTDMEGFCGEVSAFSGKKVSNIVEITNDPAVIQVAFQVLKNHKLI